MRSSATKQASLWTRILETDIPLLSSFLDIFCHQCSHIDRMSAEAWLAVWEEWRTVDDVTAPARFAFSTFSYTRLAASTAGGWCDIIDKRADALDRRLL